jgi:hypothetical protein
MRGVKDLMEYQQDIRIIESTLRSKKIIKSDKEIIQDLLKKIELLEK